MIKFKEQVKLQKISEDAWIVHDDEKRVGIPPIKPRKIYILGQNGNYTF